VIHPHLIKTYIKKLAGVWFFPGTPVSSTDKTDLRDITEILLKVALSIVKQTSKQAKNQTYYF
jgi:hypothetical protein